MNYALLNPIRNFTRKIGLNKFIAQRYFKSWQAQLRKDYEIQKPTVVSITSNNVTIKMNVESFSEYERVMSFKNDEKIIGAILQQLSRKENAVLWDIGTNIGLYSILAANSSKNVKKVVSYEPEPRCIERIKENSTLNSLEKVQVFPFALADTEGFFNLTINDEYGAGNHSLVHSSVSEGQSVLKVKVETGDNIIAKYGEEIPTVVKIDVEGAEIKVIEGMPKTLSHPECLAVMCEVHFTILNASGYANGPNQLIQLFKNYGFKHTQWVDASHLLATK